MHTDAHSIRRRRKRLECPYKRAEYKEEGEEIQMFMQTRGVYGGRRSLSI